VELPSGLNAAEGQEVELLYIYTQGPTDIDADAFIGLVEI
jgi:hypothetical protein